MKKNKTKKFNLWKACYDRPDLFYKHILGINVWSKQLEVTEAVRDNRRTSVRSPHGTGKSFISAAIALYFFYMFEDVGVFLIAPTEKHAKDAIFKEVRQIYGNCPNPLNNVTVGMTEMKQGVDKLITIVPVRDDAQAQGSLKGLHRKNILFIIDESTNIPEGTFTAIQSAMSNDGAHLLMISNPYRRTGTFFKSFHEDSDLYHNIHITQEDILTDGAHIKGLSKQQFFDDIAKIYGKDSGTYRIQALGEFPFEDDIFSLISEQQVREALDREYPLEVPKDRDDVRALKEALEEEAPVISVDPAGEGKDNSVICIRRGLTFEILKILKQNNGVELAGEVADIARSVYSTDNIYPIIAVDNIGVGASCYDTLKANNDPDIASRVRGVHFGSRANRSDLYYNHKAECYDLLRQFTQFGVFKYNNEDEKNKIIEMSYCQYERDSQLRIKLEKKEKLKERIGKSPDVPDAMAISLGACLNPSVAPIEWIGTF